MKEIKYLSPSAISTFEFSVEEYYLKYLCDIKISKEPQNQAMAVGSSFDCHCKAWLYKELFKNRDDVDNEDKKYDLETLLKSQVDPVLLEWATQHGKYVFEQYKQSGALYDLLLELQKGVGVRFEFEVMGAVSGYREGRTEVLGDIVLMGKPDVSWSNSYDQHVILDFKVNGYASIYAVSPKPGYIRLRSAGKTDYKMHNNCRLRNHNGILINEACYLEDIDVGWARQLCIYSWLLGNPIGGEQVFAIDQVVCTPAGVGCLPRIRIAEHRLLCRPEWQHKLYNRICEIWDIVHSDWIFRDMSREDSISRCQLLDQQAMSGVDPIFQKERQWR